MGIKKCLAGILLVWKALWLSEAQTLVRIIKKEVWGSDAQGGHIREEDADEQRAERGGYRGAVHSPSRWLLEDTGPAGARRE